jgi:ribosomal protein S12 methylthiotransferase
MTAKKKRVSVITLGCSKNTVDSEVLLRQLQAAGIETSHDPPEVHGGTVIINTCGFIRDAQEESVEMILRFAEARKRGDIDRLIVMGCLSQRFGRELREEISGVDAFYGVHHLADIVRDVGANYHYELLTRRSLTTPPHYAYLKISEGCSRHCAFCSIPAIRGRHVSRPMEEIIDEASWLAGRGVREIILIAQDLTWYGRDLYGRQQLPLLLKQLSSLPFRWIRLHYAYPSSFPREIIALMKEKENICHYLDIPFQHISDDVLKKMRRSSSERTIRRLTEQLRREIPDIALRTTFLVGHPGEKKKDFEKLLDFIRETRFERLGVFAYSHEEGTYAWRHYRNSVPEKVKQERVEQVMTLQEEIAAERNRKSVGETFPVLIDRREGDYWVGRTQYDSPGVDQEVLVKEGSGTKIKPGDFYKVKIIRAEGFDLFGVTIG